MDKMSKIHTHIQSVNNIGLAYSHLNPFRGKRGHSSSLTESVRSNFPPHFFCQLIQLAGLKDQLSPNSFILGEPRANEEMFFHVR